MTPQTLVLRKTLKNLFKVRNTWLPPCDVSGFSTGRNTVTPLTPVLFLGLRVPWGLFNPHLDSLRGSWEEVS